jgi:hypothetical protein
MVQKWGLRVSLLVAGLAQSVTAEDYVPQFDLRSPMMLETEWFPVSDRRYTFSDPIPPEEPNTIIDEIRSALTPRIRLSEHCEVHFALELRAKSSQVELACTF